MVCSHFILIFCLAALSAVQTTDGFSTVQRRTQHTTSLQLWPAVKEETNTDSVEQAVDENNQSTLLKKLFDTTGSSSLRSTSQTDALGQKTTTDTEESDESGIPPEVLKPFSLLILSQFILFLGVGAVIPAIPLYGQSIGLSSASNGIVISTPAVALLLVSRFAGVFADKGRKAAMMSGMFIIAIADAGTAFSNNLATLVVARLGLGLGRGLAEAGERGMLTDLANQTPKLRGRALAIQQASVGIGIAIGAPAGGYIVEEYGVRSSFLCVSAAAIAALGLYALLPETVGNSLTSVEASTTKVKEKSSENEADWMELLKTSQTWRSLTICQAGVSVGYACKIAIIPILASTYLGGATGAGFLLSAAGLSGLGGAVIGGTLSDQIGSRKAAALSGTISGIALASIPVGLSLQDRIGSDSFSFETVVGGPDATIFAGLVILWSVAVSAQGPALTSLGQLNAKKGAEATSLGLPRAAGDATYIAAPLILGAVSDRLGDIIPGAACAVAGFAIIIGSAALFTVEDGKE
ncbi:MFS transporter [Skeletonema marinoi]|uniref:MFS transporter n=2 Tax=Skeletonema marinoi TaxID=267567 RepID=A0AAD8YBN8_9STRA|nr:MFS transporter [Skeletonema marinoi]